MHSRYSLITLSAILFLSVSAAAKVVTENTAKDVVRNYMISNGLTAKELIPYHSTPDNSETGRAPQRDDAPAYHLFRDIQNNSLIVVAGDDIARPILGYSFNLNPDDCPDIPPAMLDWLEDIEKQILLARKNGISQTSRIAKQWSNPDGGNVVKQLKTAKWNQQYPYNLQCPIQDGVRCYTGCTATAYAIVMKYYGYPSAGRGMTPAYTCSTSGIYVPSRNINHTYDWNSMPNQFNYGSYTNEQANSVARLMADIGAALQADYTNKETSALYGKSAIFAHFGYNVGLRKNKSDYTSDEWSSLLRNEIDKNRPVLYNGASEQGQGSHAFLIDGYTDQDYFCVNWGWGGSYDGAYALDALELDFIDYKSDQAAYPDFRPADGLTTVATVNGIMCPSFEAAVGMVQFNGQPDTVTLIENSTTDEVYFKNGQNVVLDLNGCTVEIDKWGLFNYGKLTVTDSKGGGKISMKRGNASIINNYGELVVEAGEFINLLAGPDEGPDYRRCIWSDALASTILKGGKYNCLSQVICTNGKLTIDGGEFECSGNSDVIINYAFTDTVTINGGVFKNNTSGTFCRAVWTAENTQTHITGGSFSSTNSTICTNGLLLIDNGEYNCTGNSTVIANYAKADTVTINGGTFKNTLKAVNGNDYRRAVWTTDESVTHITGGQFSSNYQVLTFNGNAIIDGGTITNTGSGIGCLSHAKVVINYCMLSAATILSANTGYTIKCYGGLYSKAVGASFLASGYSCSRNFGSNSANYPYKVTRNANEIETIITDTDQSVVHYDMNGTVQSENAPGIHIIRKPDGKTIKVLYK